MSKQLLIREVRIKLLNAQNSDAGGFVVIQNRRERIRRARVALAMPDNQNIRAGVGKGTTHVVDEVAI